MDMFLDGNSLQHNIENMRYICKGIKSLQQI